MLKFSKILSVISFFTYLLSSILFTLHTLWYGLTDTILVDISITSLLSTIFFVTIILSFNVKTYTERKEKIIKTDKKIGCSSCKK